VVDKVVGKIVDKINWRMSVLLEGFLAPHSCKEGWVHSASRGGRLCGLGAECCKEKWAATALAARDAELEHDTENRKPVFGKIVLKSKSRTLDLSR
jgi:hypothetical protein